MAPTAFALASVAFAWSFRARAYVSGDSLVVRSYFRTHCFRVNDIDEVLNVPYAGMLNSYSAADGRGPLGVRMLEVVTKGRDWPLPATMMSRRNAARVAMLLNERLKENRSHSPAAEPDFG